MARKSNAGRPTVVTEKIIRKLEEAFTKDFTDAEACLFADISTTAFYEYQKSHPEFAERKKQLKNSLALRAKNNISDKVNTGDVEISKWWLERRRKDDFSTKSEQSHSGDISINKSRAKIADRFARRHVGVESDD